MGTKRSQMDATLDASLILKDAGAVTADGAGTVDGNPRVVNVGTGLLKAAWVNDISTLDLAGGDEVYDIILQGSTDPTFATNVSVLARIRAGAGIGEDSFGIGRVSRLFTNTAEDGEVLPYLRVYSDVTAGAGGASINFQSYIMQDVLP